MRKVPKNVHNQKAGNRAGTIEASSYNKVSKKHLASKAKKIGVQKADHYGASRTRRTR